MVSPPKAPGLIWQAGEREHEPGFRPESTGQSTSTPLQREVSSLSLDMAMVGARESLAQGEGMQSGQRYGKKRWANMYARYDRTAHTLPCPQGKRWERSWWKAVLCESIMHSLGRGIEKHASRGIGRCAPSPHSR